MKPFISVVIPAYNEESTISKCLDSLKNLNYPKELLETIIINDGSIDKTQDIAESYNVTVIKTEGVGPSAARNLGIEHAKGELVAFTDADCIVDKEWINQLLLGFNQDTIIGVGGEQKSPSDETWFGKVVQDYLKLMGFIGGYTKSHKKITAVDHNPTCNVIYKKAVFEEVGGFLKGLWPGEDVEIDYRIKKRGYSLAYNPDAVVFHYRPKTLMKFAKMMRKYGQWAGGYLIKKYGFFRKLYYEPFALLTLVLIEILLFYFYPLAGLFSVLIALSLALSYFTVKTRRLGKGLLAFFLFIITIIQWNYGFVKGLFAKLPENR